MAIARKHLIVKQIEANGLKDGELDIGDDAVRRPRTYYTREAGVRTSSARSPTWRARPPRKSS